MHDVLIRAAYNESRNEGKPISKEQAEFICEDYFGLCKLYEEAKAELESLRKLKAEVGAAPIVYGTTVGVHVGQDIKWSHAKWVNLHRNGEPCTTHTARLVCIEEVK